MKRTPGNISKAKELEAKGMTRYRLAKRFGVSQVAIRQWLDPVFYEQCKAKVRERRADPGIRERMNARRRMLYARRRDKQQSDDLWRFIDEHPVAWNKIVNKMICH